MVNDNTTPRFSADELIQKIIHETLSDKDQFDPAIVDLIKNHLGQNRIHTRAGNLLADDLIQLAKTRSQEEE